MKKLIAIAAMLASTMGQAQTMSPADERSLRVGVEALNRTLPKDVDYLTVLHGVHMHNKIVTYTYTVDAEKEEIWEIFSDLKKDVTRDNCKLRILRRTMDMGVILRHNYRDHLHRPGVAFNVTAADCRRIGL